MIDEVLEVTFIKETIDSNNPLTDDGKPNVIKQSRVVYAQRMSITQNEYYSARAKGFKADLCLKVNCFEYNGERFCTVNGIKHEIYRTYQKFNSEFVELYLKAEIQQEV